jgi:hypothetical protein
LLEVKIYLYTGNIACTGSTSIRSNIQTGTLNFHADTHTYDFKAVITTVSPGSPPESNTVVNPGIPYRIKSPIAIKGFGDNGTLFLGSVVNNIATSALISAADANCGYQYTLTKVS